MRCHVSIVIAALMLATAARAQIPSLGFCPEYLPMPGFEMERFAGSWYEAERYFQLSEVASRCVMSNYTKGPDGKYHVSNEVTSRFTGIKRVLEGEIRKPNSKAEEGKLHVKYTTVPLIPLETQYNVLETDYKNYAVLWSCSGVGPVHTQNAWIMTRQRVAPGEILQKAYGVLDKYKISKVFFVKTNQDDCAYLDSLQAEAAKPTEPPKVAETEEEEENQALRSAVPVRQHIVPDAPEAVIQTRNAEIKAAAEAVAAAAEATATAEAAAAAVKPIAAVRQPESIAVEQPVNAAPEPTTKIPARFEQLPKLAAKEPLANEPAKEQTREEAIATPAELPIDPVLADEPSKTESKLVLEGKVEVVKP